MKRKLHALRRPRLRQSWNKYNLYNIAMAREPRLGLGEETFFQQKWRAKGLLRAYHGEHIVERKWERMFSRRLLSTVDMDAKYMASNDGSEYAAGRGSGKELEPRFDRDRVEARTITPYMQMTFAPMERRLDIAVFRAMFASSASQARQFCVHGAVKVNGKIIPYPAYRLNPGDMFQVDPDRVLYATGLPKRPPKETSGSSPKKTAATEEEAPEEEAAEEAPEETSEAEPEQDPETTDAPEPAPIDMKPTKQQIRDLTVQAKAILAERKLSVSQKKELRKFIKNIKPLLTRAGRRNASATEITNELATLVTEADIGLGNDPNAVEAAPSDPIDTLTDSELEQLEKRMEEHMREELENPRDPSKPYVTPWRPRDYMGPFAFIPKYLEVNQNICSAVYLRHPVARKGSAEVPTPYGYRANQLAFNWYLRRR